MTRLAIRSEHMRGKDGCLISILPPSRRLDTSQEGEVDIVDPPVRMRAVPKDPAVRASGLAAYDVAVLVRDEERALAYVLLGDGRPADVDADTLQRLRDYEQFQAPITRLDADGFEAAEIDERTVQWRVGDGHARWLFDSHNAACTFAELCEASGFVPAMASPPSRTSWCSSSASSSRPARRGRGRSTTRL